MVILLTISTLVSSMAAQVSYLPMPIPFISLFSVLAIHAIFVISLTKPINFSEEPDTNLEQNLNEYQDSQ